MRRKGCSDDGNHPGHVVSKPPEWWTRDHADEAARLVAAALAEVGYNVEPYAETETNPAFAGDEIPPAIFCKARRLVFDHMGVDYEVAP